MFQKTTEIRKNLNALGLSDKESQVYLNLAKFDKTGIGRLATETGLSRQNLYNYLNSLKLKGLAGEINAQHKKVFFAKDIKNLRHDFQQKIELASLLDDELAEYKIKYSNGIKLYKGQGVIRRLFIERVKKRTSRDQIFSNETSSLDFTGRFMADKFNLYENIRLNRRFKTNVMIIVEDEDHLKNHLELANNQRPYNETRVIRYTPFGFSALYVWPDRVWILLKDRHDEYEIVEIINTEVVKGFKFYFQYIWSGAEIVYKSQD